LLAAWCGPTAPRASAGVRGRCGSSPLHPGCIPGPRRLDPRAAIELARPDGEAPPLLDDVQRVVARLLRSDPMVLVVGASRAG
jgi:hypothetical protein